MFNFFNEIKSGINKLKSSLSPFQLVMVGGNLMYVEGKICLMTLTAELVVFKVDSYVIIVNGKGLELKELTTNTIKICGDICSWEKV